MSKEFNINHPLLFLLAGIAVLAVMVQSAVFLCKAMRRARELGYSREQLRKTVITAGVFSIAPAVGVGIGLITLAGTLGLALPWLRLSVVGAIMYELSAATTAAKAMGARLGEMLTAQQFSTIAWTMTVGISTGLVLIPCFCKRTLSTLNKAGEKDRVWGEHLTNAIFIGLIATFVGVGLSELTVSRAGVVQALVLAVSAIVMLLCGICKKKLGWNWMNDYALSICMILAMAAAIPLTAWLC